MKKEKETQGPGRQWVKISNSKVQFSSTHFEEELGLKVLKNQPVSRPDRNLCRCGNFQ